MAAPALGKSIVYRCFLDTALVQECLSEKVVILTINHPLEMRFALELIFTAQESLQLIDTYR